MEQFKRAQVVILSVNHKSDIGLTFKYGETIMKQYSKCNGDQQNMMNKFKNLYIISDDEIKENDHCLNLETNTVFKMHKHGLPTSNRNKKIIATTDTSLKIKTMSLHGKAVLEISLPQPSQQFIIKFIECYNKGEIITDILVEYENKYFGKEYVDEQDAYGYNVWKPILKINPKDNTITIKKLKDSWNREEVIKILNDLNNTLNIGSDLTLEEWIEKNL